MSKTERPSVCVVSRDRDWASFFSLEARACYCTVTILETPPEETGNYDLILLDDRVGYCFSDCSGCRVITVRMKNETPLARTEETGSVWTWPVSIQLLHETYESLFGRQTPHMAEEKTGERNENEEKIFLFSDGSHRVLYRNQVIVLTESEWMILVALGKGNASPVSREQIGLLLSSDGGNAPDVHICHLRKKLEDPFGKKLICTIRNQGYLLKANMIEKAELV